MAVEARLGIGIGFFIGRAVGHIGRVLPIAVAPCFRYRRAPARALFHHGDTRRLALDEVTLGIAFGLAVGAFLGRKNRQRQHCAVGYGFALAYRFHHFGFGIQLAVLLYIMAIELLIHLPFFEARRKRNVLRPYRTLRHQHACSDSTCGSHTNRYFSTKQHRSSRFNEKKNTRNLTTT